MSFHLIKKLVYKKTDIKPQWNLPPLFFSLPNFFSVKRKGQPGVSKKNLWCGVRIQMYRPVNKGRGLQSLKIYNFSFKKKYILEH